MGIAVLVVIVTAGGVYGLAAIVTAIVQWRARTCLRQALLEGRDQLAVSLAWAWASENEIVSLQRYWGAGRFGDILTFPKPSSTRRFLPHILLMIAGVVFYQAAIRGGSPIGVGSCPSSPNCSNYAIGCLARYPALTALAKTRLRIDNCGYNSRTTYREDFR